MIAVLFIMEDLMIARIDAIECGRNGDDIKGPFVGRACYVMLLLMNERVHKIRDHHHELFPLGVLFYGTRSDYESTICNKLERFHTKRITSDAGDANL